MHSANAALPHVPAANAHWSLQLCNCACPVLPPACQPPTHLQENQFLLGLGVSCAAVLSIAVVLMSFMWQSFKQEQQLQDQVGLCCTQ